MALSPPGADMTLTSTPRDPGFIQEPTGLSAVTLLRLPAVLKARGRSRSTHYADIKLGLFTPPVKLGDNCVGWPEAEVIALNRATIAGASQDDIRALVGQLVASRRGGSPRECP